MKFTFHSEDVLQLRTDVCALLCFEGSVQDGPVLRALDAVLSGLPGQLVTRQHQVHGHLRPHVPQVPRREESRRCQREGQHRREHDERHGPL